MGTNEVDIYSEFSRLLRDKKEYQIMSQTANPYGDGNSSKKIVDILERELNK